MEGNQMKMRDALEAFVESVEWLCEGDESGRLKQQFGALLSAARAALSAPARNCDVGTEEEQAERFKKFCFGHQTPWHGCTNCAVLMSEKCAITWGQMPYEAKEGEAR